MLSDGEAKYSRRQGAMRKLGAQPLVPLCQADPSKLLVALRVFSLSSFALHLSGGRTVMPSADW